MRRRLTLLLCGLALLLLSAPLLADGPLGYYRQPAIHGDTVVFVAEGDLWRVSVTGGAARRLTSHPAEESHPAISPDGTLVAFVGRYEGTAEIYTMPLDGGLPTRRTWGEDEARVVGWSGAREVLYSTRRFSGLPSWQLARLAVVDDAVAAAPRLVPLAQAADGAYDDAGDTLYFARQHFQGSHTKRYRGGTAENLWRFAAGDDEATPLTADYPGTSKRPMWWRGRVYFASDRDRQMNLWSMAPDGGDLRQHTRHSGWEVQSPSLHDGRIVYRLGADLRLYDIAADSDRPLEITLPSDLDQTRERWIDEPAEFLTAYHLSPDGDRVVLTARGQVFVAPRQQGRLVEAVRAPGVRYRQARFMPDGKRLVALSDASGEVEVWTLPANGVGEPQQLTRGADVLRWDALPSPDGSLIAHHDKHQRLFVHDVASGEDRLVDESPIDGFRDLAWSPDGRWLAYVATEDNLFSAIRLYDVEGRRIVRATTDRFDSYSPAWSRDGRRLYFISDRHLESVVGSPWGNYQPEPFLDKRGQLFLLALRDGERSPFAPRTELDPGTDDAEEKTDHDGKGGDAKKEEEVRVVIDEAGLEERLDAIPVPPGNYSDLSVTDDALYWLERDAGEREARLRAAKIVRVDLKVETVATGLRGYELSADGKRLLLRRKNDLFVVDAAPAEAKLDTAKVDLSAWRLSVVPREEWRQMFVEAWRLERDYFYDKDMHGVDWPAMLERYLPLVDRVTTRRELADAMAQMVSELSALHTFVRAGDVREGDEDVPVASLGAVLERDEPGGGYRVAHRYRSDPDDLDRRGPLEAPGVDVADGDVIEAVNGVPTLSVPHIGALLRGQAGRQVLLRVAPGAGGESRDVVVTPVTQGAADDLRYHEWEYTRRLAVEQAGAGEIGYVHLRAMGGDNFTEWAREFYPVFTRKGLIIDVRHNRGGNIDSWIIGRLLRRAWFYWSQHQGQAPSWNMQYAFRGHVAVLCDERTASDGEAFTEGIKRLDLGTVIGTRTWGGEIWLSSNNFLVDGGIATAAEYGVFGPEGEWLIEGWGVEPDVVVDNLPHATFEGRDAQLEAAIEHLKTRLREEPVPDLPPPPPYPDKSFDYR